MTEVFEVGIRKGEKKEVGKLGRGEGAIKPDPQSS